MQVLIKRLNPRSTSPAARRSVCNSITPRSSARPSRTRRSPPPPSGLPRPPPESPPCAASSAAVLLISFSASYSPCQRRNLFITAINFLKNTISSQIIAKVSLVLCKAFFARLVHGKLANKKPLAEWQGAFRLAAATASVAEEQHAGGFFFAGCFVGGDGAIEELVDFQVDFEEGR